MSERQKQRKFRATHREACKTRAFEQLRLLRKGSTPIGSVVCLEQALRDGNLPAEAIGSTEAEINSFRREAELETS